MLRILSDKASFQGGMVNLGNGTFLYHLIQSPSVTNIVTEKDGTSVPTPTIFSYCGGTTSTNSIELFSTTNPRISMLRLLLSPLPYITNCHMDIGFTTKQGHVILFKTPQIRTAEFGYVPLKLPSYIMVTKSQLMKNSMPLEMDAATMALTAPYKHVSINEEKNSVVMFDSSKPIKDFHKQSSPYIPRPIIKLTIPGQDTPPNSHRVLEAKLFNAISLYPPKHGHGPEGPLRTVTIMTRSQNSLYFLPQCNINPVQHLYLKHLLLYRLGMESVYATFETLYVHHVADVSCDQITFETLMQCIQRRVEDAVFCLNSIQQHIFQESVNPDDTNPRTRTAMEKYFLMFAPRDRKNAINFAASIITRICSGEPLTKVLLYMAKYMDIKQDLDDDTFIKIYALLTI
uniref:Tegument protein UL88 n=1 Tax=Bovine herpesvirus 4 TaxID=10385 RepID=A0A858PWV9_BHV4|nr:hypothetical protein [Bovine gammaherpesvirus 4]WIV69321.1 hypothetical protein [Bovine gammaherpesvirus 4]